jgi:hypothetical protein
MNILVLLINYEIELYFIDLYIIKMTAVKDMYCWKQLFSEIAKIK